MKNAIGKPYEGKPHVRFEEGGTDSSYFEDFSLYLIKFFEGGAIRLYSTCATKLIGIQWV